MPRGTASFRQADVTRALRAARAAGLEVSGYEINPLTGKIIITTLTSAGERKAAETDLDKWIASHAD
jgi:hypothetical protein